jgi:GNAT superfamily N-acetyltransferase
MLAIREAELSDLDALVELYRFHLVEAPPPPADMQAMLDTLQRIVEDAAYHLLAGESSGRIVSSVTIVIVKNLTHGARPYALIENVVTHADYRGRGFAQALMARACGYNRKDKTGFVKWL